MMPLMLYRNTDTRRRCRATKPTNSLVAIATSHWYKNLTAKLIVGHQTIIVLTADNCQCIHDNNVQPEMRQCTCHCCLKKGHFKSVCWSKAVDDISDDSSDTTSSTRKLSFLDIVSSEFSITGGSQSRTVVLGLSSGQTEFKIDNGADVTVVPEQVY